MMVAQDYFGFGPDNERTAIIRTFGGEYFITDSGKVWDNHKKVFLEQCIYTANGYYVVEMLAKHILVNPDYGILWESVEVRFLVAKNFLLNTKAYTDVEPIDGNRWNHSASNLRWVAKDSSLPPPVSDGSWEAYRAIMKYYSSYPKD